MELQHGEQIEAIIIYTKHDLVGYITLEIDELEFADSILRDHKDMELNKKFTKETPSLRSEMLIETNFGSESIMIDKEGLYIDGEYYIVPDNSLYHGIRVGINKENSSILVE